MPILNHRDYRSARAQLAQLARALGPGGMIADITAYLPADVAAARRQALLAEAQRLETDIAAYEKLRGGIEETESEPGLDVDGLGLVPIFGRIARRWSQR